MLMPHHPILYDRIPASATQALRATINEAFGDDAPPILDYQQAMDEPDFYDVSHLNGAGRATFTSLLARDIQPHLPHHSPRIMQLVGKPAAR